jgi:hypothetical protein
MTAINVVKFKSKLLEELEDAGITANESDIDSPLDELFQAAKLVVDTATYSDGLATLPTNTMEVLERVIFAITVGRMSPK